MSIGLSDHDLSLRTYKKFKKSFLIIKLNYTYFSAKEIQELTIIRDLLALSLTAQERSCYNGW